MPIIEERIATTARVDDAFAFVADFGNASRWDPGVAAAEGLDARPIGVGSRFRLGVRMRGRVVPMTYRITTFDPPRRVVLSGRGSGVEAVDDIRFEATPDGTAITYLADIRLLGLLRLATPFAGGAFAKIGRDARDGLRDALTRLAAGPADPPVEGGEAAG